MNFQLFQSTGNIQKPPRFFFVFKYLPITLRIINDIFSYLNHLLLAYYIIYSKQKVVVERFTF